MEAENLRCGENAPRTVKLWVKNEKMEDAFDEESLFACCESLWIDGFIFFF